MQIAATMCASYGWKTGGLRGRYGKAGKWGKEKGQGPSLTYYAHVCAATLHIL